MAGFVGPEIPGVTDGLVFYVDAALTYNSGSTIWYDKIGDVECTLTNGPTYSSDGYGSIVFDGTNDDVKTGIYDLDFGLNSFTLSAWIKTAYNYQSGKIINKGQSIAFPEGSMGYSLRFFNTLRFAVTDGTISTHTTVNNQNDMPLNEWTLVTGVCDRQSGYQKLYINNSLNNQSLISYSSVTNSDAQLTIGSLTRAPHGHTSEFFNGSVSIVKIYNRALSNTEITQNYNALKGRFNL